MAGTRGAMKRTTLAKGGAAEAAVGDVLRVAAYLRVSTDEQAESGLGIAAQRTRCAGMAAAKGWPEPVVYADEGVSGTREAKDRPALAHLLADVHSGQVDAVAVLALDRLGRKTRIVLDLVEQLQDAGVVFVSCKEALDTATATGQFVLTMFAALAQLERDLTSERTIAALAELGQTTGDRGGRLPYGYVRVSEAKGGGDGTVRVDPAAAATVRRIFDWHRRGQSLRTIAERLRKEGVPGPRGGQWNHSGVYEVLKNRAAYHGGQRGASPHAWPAILGRGASAA